MEPEIPVQSPPIDDLGAAPDRRKLLIIIAGVTIFIIIIVVILVFSTSRQDSQSSTNNRNLPSPTKSLSSQVQASPAVVAKAFYDWYVNHPSPIKSGAYELREDTTAEFKETMGVFLSRGIDPGYDHVFCEISSLPQNVTLQEPTYNEDKTAALILFKDISGSQDLFQMKLESIQGKWLVSDVWCPPTQRPEI